jgi:hypothetical protein
MKNNAIATIFLMMLERKEIKLTKKGLKEIRENNYCIDPTEDITIENIDRDGVISLFHDGQVIYDVEPDYIVLDTENTAPQDNDWFLKAHFTISHILTDVVNKGETVGKYRAIHTTHDAWGLDGVIEIATDLTSKFVAKYQPMEIDSENDWYNLVDGFILSETV